MTPGVGVTILYFVYILKVIFLISLFKEYFLTNFFKKYSACVTGGLDKSSP